MKIQLENITPSEIENRSMEIISQELVQLGITLNKDSLLLLNVQYMPLPILNMPRTYIFQKM